MNQNRKSTTINSGCAHLSSHPLEVALDPEPNEKPFVVDALSKEKPVLAAPPCVDADPKVKFGAVDLASPFFAPKEKVDVGAAAVDVVATPPSVDETPKENFDDPDLVSPIFAPDPNEKIGAGVVAGAVVATAPSLFVDEVKVKPAVAVFFDTLSSLLLAAEANENEAIGLALSVVSLAGLAAPNAKVSPTPFPSFFSLLFPRSSSSWRRCFS